MRKLLLLLLAVGVISIISLGASYAEFSAQKYPDTNGYDPEFLKEHKDILTEICHESSKKGYDKGFGFCEFIKY